MKVEGGKNYTLRVGGYDAKGSSALDALTFHDGMQFSTIDRDRDPDDRSCSGRYGGGGWWYWNCYKANPTGVYARDRPAEEMWNEGIGQFVAWGTSYDSSLSNARHITQLTLMIRPKG
ncbi:ficolin-1-B [Hyalella azteca]|uniref:Ficolin-1-B n=1 Tax=Hyalella azteca TaxID=294128 RepID=A0A8B7NFY2_HYAAZ|nr:ficolin-1-B [Hyalella azteca]